MSSRTHAREREATGRTPWVAGLVVLLLLLVCAGGFWWLNRDDEKAASGCDDPVGATVGVTPDLAPALIDAADALADEDPCTQVEVNALTSPDAVKAFISGTDTTPDVWIPDSVLWVQQLRDSGIRSTVVAESVASSPVVLAGGPSADEPASWIEVLGTGRVEVQDPTQDSASGAILAAPRAEAAKTKINKNQLAARMVPLAQQYGARTVRMVDDVLTGITTTSKELVPVTEQRFLAARKENNALSLVVPATGTVPLTYPAVNVSEPSAEATEATTAFLEFLAGEEGTKILGNHDFRGADGAPLDAGVGAGEVDLLSPPDIKDVQTDLRRWTVLAVPTSILAVFDTSGSMDFETGDGTRMELATNAARTALTQFPSNARVGLWSFSIDQDGPGTDYKQLAPLRPLGKGNHTAVLNAQLDKMVNLPEGGTGLYDTTLAAYRAATKQYDAAYFNAVVILSDGANEDPDSIELAQLLKQLREQADASRPVRIIAIGISKDADMKALTQIATATGGGAYAARDPRDILQVISQALLAR